MKADCALSPDRSSFMVLRRPGVDLGKDLGTGVKHTDLDLGFANTPGY